MNYGSIGSYPHEETSRSASAEIDDIDDDDDEQYHDAQQQHHHHQYHHDAQSMGGSSVASSVRDLIVDRALTHSGRPVSVRNFGGTSTITRSSITLVKNIVGAGVLALPSGVSTFATSPSAVIPSSIWLVVMGIVFGYEFQLIGKVCDMTVSSTFREAWDDTVGRNIDNDDRDNIDDEVHPPSSSLPSSLVSRHAGTVVSWVNMLKPALANLAYSMILADTFRSLFATIGWDVTRTGCLLLVTLMGILPLCLLKNLDALAPFSMLGTVSILLITVCMGIRCYDGTYDPIDGIYIDSLPEKYRPIFGTYNGYWTVSVLVYVAMIFEAYIAHYNAPRFYTELHDATIRRFRIVVGNGFGLSTILYILIMSFGYLTFGGNCDGYILNNYSDNDSLMTVSRFVISFSILFTYPVTFMGTRDGILDILKLPEEKQTSTNVNIITIVLLTVITLLATITKDLGMINAVGGGSLATLIVFVFPALMYRAAIDHQVAPPTRVQKQEVLFATTLMVLGLIMGAIGVVVELARI